LRTVSSAVRETVGPSCEEIAAEAARQAAEAARQADANRARYGRSKSDRAQGQQQRERAKALLDQHRLDDGEAS